MFGESDESPKMFESPFIDFFSRTHWVLVPIIYVPLILAAMTWSLYAGVVWYVAIAQFVLGVFVWTLLEYWLHRTLFHYVPPFSWGEKFHFFLHGVHHDWYRDRYRLVMPPAASLSLGVMFFAGFSATAFLFEWLLSPNWVWAFFAGVMCGYLFYDLTHYYIHHGRPRSGVMKRLKTHHAKHHHNPQFAKRKYGVSTTLWDHVFGTY